MKQSAELDDQTVIVAVTLNVRVRSRWGDECTLGQLRKQAIEEASGTIRRMFDGAEATVPLTAAEKRDVQMLRMDVDTVAWHKERK
jgi:hypothetical protein